MGTVANDQICRYLNSQGRNKIIFYREDIQGISPGNVGQSLAKVIYNWKGEMKLGLKISNDLEGIFSKFIIYHSVYGEILPITNLGIILEPELKLNLSNILEKYSINTPLFVQWQGAIEKDDIYFLSKEKGTKISIKNLSHIWI